jgi:hypothetical protein
MNQVQEYDAVRLLGDWPQYGLRRGDTGAVLIVQPLPSLAYLVEFCTDSGEIKCMIALEPMHIERVEAKPEGMPDRE